jgi:hypothetical protein
MKSLSQFLRSLNPFKRISALRCQTCLAPECRCWDGVVGYSFEADWFTSAPSPLMESYAKRKRRHQQ